MRSPTDGGTSSPLVRPAVAADEAGVRRLMRGERVNPFGIDWRNFVVAEAAGEVVGCAQLRPTGI